MSLEAQKSNAPLPLQVFEEGRGLRAQHLLCSQVIWACSALRVVRVLRVFRSCRACRALREFRAHGSWAQKADLNSTCHLQGLQKLFAEGTLKP